MKYSDGPLFEQQSGPCALSFYLHALFLSLPLIATLKGKGIVVLVALLTLVYGPSFWGYRHQVGLAVAHSLRTLLGKTIFLLTAWILFSVLWADNLARAALNAGRYSLLISIGVLLFFTISQESVARRALLLKAFYKGIIFYIFFLFAEIYIFPSASRMYTGSINYNKELFIRGIVILGFLFWPFVLATSKKFSHISFEKIFIFLWGGLIMILVRARPDAALVGGLFGGMGVLLAYYSSRILRGFFVLFSLLALSAPFLFRYILTVQNLGCFFNYLPTSYQHRLLIWNGMSEKILAHPLIGYGFDSSTAVTGGAIACLTHTSLAINWNTKEITQNLGSFHGCDPIFSSHPHNGIIQLWFECGVIGILLGLGMLFAIIQCIQSVKESSERACLFGSLVFYSVIHLVAFGLWQTWVAATLIIMSLGFLAAKNYAPLLYKHV